MTIGDALALVHLLGFAATLGIILAKNHGDVDDFGDAAFVMFAALIGAFLWPGTLLAWLYWRTTPGR